MKEHRKRKKSDINDSACKMETVNNQTTCERQQQSSLKEKNIVL